MAYTVGDFIRESFNRLIKDLDHLTSEQTRLLLERMDAQDVLRSLPVEERLRGLGPEELRQLQEYLKKLH